jgi:farnesyl diphosphate synthase
MTAPQLLTGFDHERRTIDAELEKLLSGGQSRERGRVLEAMRYAVLGDGKRIRPLLALRVASAAGGAGCLQLRAGAAVELLHCASLIVDDLPSMDNAAERRGRPCAHVAFGEATALLAAFGLVALAARAVMEIPSTPTELDRLLAFQLELLRTLDVDGLIEGQALDLDLAHSPGSRLYVNELKTVPLFELAGAAGALLSQAPQYGEARRFGRAFGRAFQMADDLLDGDGADYDAVVRCIETARRRMDGFATRRGELDELLDYLHVLIAEKNHCYR